MLPGVWPAGESADVFCLGDSQDPWGAMCPEGLGVWEYSSLALAELGIHLWWLMPFHRVMDRGVLPRDKNVCTQTRVRERFVVRDKFLRTT